MAAVNEGVDVPNSPRISLSAEWLRRRLAPLMRMWRAGIKVTLVRIPRPFDDPHCSAPGLNSDRILIFGAGLAVGWGVSTHDLALPGFLARSLSALTGRGADVDVVAHPDILLEDALRQLNALPLWRYDALVVVLGVNAALHLAPLKVWRWDLAALLAGLEETFPGKPVVIAGIQRIRSIPVYNSVLGGIADTHATMLNRATAQLCAETQHATFAPLPEFAMSADGRHRSPDTYAASARALAAVLVPALAVPGHQIGDPYRPLPHDEERAEAARQAAVDELDLSDAELIKAIDQILAITQLSFQVKAAVLTVLDHDRQLLRASTWASLTEVPRAGSFCDATIRQRGGMVVPDALQDERFRDNPLVVGEPRIRFYAGFPLESFSGERLGTLCVFDTEPRPADDVDLAGLRDMALMVQRELRTSR
jgi:lysophospholipase L1-like esterase